ncbi:MAG: hypothetical protein FJW09_09485 [Actinobacteria bacterium]|nr:hypothetical protein [Actinomycetota bacterium]
MNNHPPVLHPPVTSLKPWDLPCEVRPNLHTVSRGGRPTISGRIPVAQALYLEWTAMCSDRRLLREVNGWGLPGRPIGHLDELLIRSGLDGRSDDDDSDYYLALIQQRATTDELAARVVLQRLMPAMLSIATKRGPITDNGTIGAFEAVVSAAWAVIRRYPIARRPVHVAGNLVRDIEYAAFVRDRRLKSATTETVVGDKVLDLVGAHHARANGAHDPVAAAGEVEALLADLARSGLSAADIQMLRSVMHDVNSAEAAGALGINARSVRNRRASALKRAREVLTVNVADEGCS